MIIAKLINPQIFYKDGEKYSFTNTLIFEQDGVAIERREISLPYAMPDPEIEVLVKQMAVDKALELEIIQDAQESLQWDWPDFDIEVQ